jgi:hypothetical protein
MPFCRNDTSKKYTGREKSPLGLGYSASVEPVNKIQIGKNNDYYIVKQYNNNLKRWKKINDFTTLFDDLPKEYFTDAYKPITKSITTETGLEEKFGGEIPFFIKDEKWPSSNEYNMTFFCQFKDPRKKDNILYRVFINIDEPYGICDDYWINKIELSPQNIKKQIIIKKPEYSKQIKKKIELEHIELENNFKPFEIIEWKKHSEIKSFSKIIEYFNIPEYNINNTNKEYNKLQEEYGDSPNSPEYGVKVGGTPVSTQDQDSVLEYDLLQLAYEHYINYPWGDAGIAHISENCHLIWDCC